MDFGCQNQELNFFFFINYPLSGILWKQLEVNWDTRF
jgi:hypothetical protein